MRTKELLYKELDYLSNHDILKVYDLVMMLKKQSNLKPLGDSKSYLRARESLKDIAGSLSDDINEERKERI